MFRVAACVAACVCAMAAAVVLLFVLCWFDGCGLCSGVCLATGFFLVLFACCPPRLGAYAAVLIVLD